MKLAVLIGVAAVAAAQPALAANWHFAVATTYIDLDSIAKYSNKSGAIQFWTHQKIVGVQMTNRWIGRCDTHSLALVHTIVYRDGVLISDQKTAFDPMASVVSGDSIGGKTLEIACKQRTAGAQADPATVKQDISWRHPVL